MKNLTTFLLFLVLLASACQEKNPCFIKLPSLIGDNMVLQQKTDVRIWGTSSPDHKIVVSPEWGSPVTVRAAKDGKWLAEVPTPEAGGPFTIRIDGRDTTITIKNVLIGEVWFCSGQSNMEMPLAGWPPNDTIMHSAESIAGASFPLIRLFNVQRKVSGVPLEDCTGEWLVCSPATVPPFSATAFFFGRKLHNDLGIPVGLIESAWGGTPSEAWTSADVLKEAGEFVDQIDAMKRAEGSLAEYQQWLDGRKQVAIKPAGDRQWEDLDFGDAQLPEPRFDDSKWLTMTLPSKFEDAVGEIDGAVWFRKKIEIPPDMAGKELVLSLGPIDDMDRSYFNGQLVGATERSGYWQINREYPVPGEIVRAGENIVAVRVMDTQGGGGIYGDPGSMRLSEKSGKQTIDLGGQWKYQAAAELVGDKFYIFDFTNNEFSQKERPKALGPYSPSTLYNAMVHPVVNYRIKGAIWYQGEANVGRAEQYEKIFPLMIRNWRDAWGIKDFPFYYVQIAPWIYAGLDADNSVSLREAQAKALSVPKTGMVVTLDIATVLNIHPPFKLEAGERLANLALANDYGKDVPANGPVYKSMVIDGATAKISFSNAESGLVSKDEYIPEFEIAGKDGRFVRAVARIVGNEVWVSAPQVREPESVRYCWKNGSVGTLSNGDGLPASQFSTID